MNQIIDNDISIKKVNKIYNVRNSKLGIFPKINYHFVIIKSIDKINNICVVELLSSKKNNTHNGIDREIFRWIDNTQERYSYLTGKTFTLQLNDDWESYNDIKINENDDDYY